MKGAEPKRYHVIQSLVVWPIAMGITADDVTEVVVTIATVAVVSFAIDAIIP